MKGVKTDERFERVVNASFDNEKSSENNSLSFTQDEKGLFKKEFSKSSSPFLFVIKLLKQLVFFLPGTLILFSVSMMLTLLVLAGPPPGTTVHVSNDFFIPITLSFLIPASLVWFGLGDVRRPKHLAIPVSVIITGIIIGAILSGVAILFPQLHGEIFFTNKLSFYFLPIALVVPNLVKGWVDRKSKDS